MKSLNKSTRNIVKTEGDESGSFLPQIGRRTVTMTEENYNFTSSKKSEPPKELSKGFSLVDRGAIGQEDRALIEELSRKIEDQKKEIEHKNQAMMALQRNYDGISSMVKREKDLGLENKRKVAALTEKNSKLTEENQVLAKRVEELTATVTNLEHEIEAGAKDKKKLGHLIEEQETLRKKVQELLEQLEKKRKEITDFEWKQKGLVAQVEKLKNIVSGLEEEKEKNIEEIKQLGDEAARCREEVLEYKQRQEDLDKVVEENIDYRKNIQGLGKENKELRDTDIIKDDLIESWRKKIEGLQDDIIEKTETISQLHIQQEEATKEINYLKERVNGLGIKNEELDAKNTKTNFTLVETLNELTLTKAKLSQTETRLKLLYEQNTEALEKLEQMDEEKFKEKSRQLEEKEKQVSDAILKLDHAQSSLGVSLSCCECLKYLKNPITLVPCGHNYCETCIPKTPFCKECEGKDEFLHTFKNEKLAEVVAKASYNQVIIEGLKKAFLI